MTSTTTRSKRILVTGGAGFLGSHLCLRLLTEGHNVICLDNLSTGQTENIQQLNTYPSFTFIQHDIMTPIKLDVDQIYNLACPASPIHYQKKPIETTKTCVVGTLNLLELSQKNNATLLQASTSEVYGDPLVHPQDESYWGHVNPIGPRSCYDEGKRVAESLCFDFLRTHNTSIKIARIFNTYGPNMSKNDGRVISNFIIQALNNEPITIYGTGTQTRSFCFVDDLIEGLIKLMNSDKPITGPINLGNPNETTINDIAKKIIELTNSNSKICHNELPTDDPKQRKPNINQAQKVLNWQPDTNLENGLKKTILFFRSLLE